MNNKIKLTPPNPYLIRAFYEWLVDNDLTPHIIISAKIPDVVIPLDYVQDEKLVLNVSPDAIRNLRIDNDLLECDAQFAKITHHISTPICAITAVYAKENGVGMSFAPEDYFKYVQAKKTKKTSLSLMPKESKLKNKKVPAKKGTKPKLTLITKKDK